MSRPKAEDVWVFNDEERIETVMVLKGHVLFGLEKGKNVEPIDVPDHAIHSLKATPGSVLPMLLVMAESEEAENWKTMTRAEVTAYIERVQKVGWRS